MIRMNGIVCDEVVYYTPPNDAYEELPCLADPEDQNAVSSGGKSSEFKGGGDLDHPANLTDREDEDDSGDEGLTALEDESIEDYDVNDPLPFKEPTSEPPRPDKAQQQDAKFGEGFSKGFLLKQPQQKTKAPQPQSEGSSSASRKEAGGKKAPKKAEDPPKSHKAPPAPKRPAQTQPQERRRPPELRKEATFTPSEKLLKKASELIGDQLYERALTSLQEAEETMKEDLGRDSPDYRSAKYLVIKYLIKEGDQRRLGFYDDQKLELARTKINFLLERWTEGRCRNYLPLVHYLSAQLYLKYNDFPSALDEVVVSQEILKKQGIQKVTLPMTTLPILESDEAWLQGELSQMEENCQYQMKNPDYKCNGKNCESLHHRKKIYEDDFRPFKYPGYHQIECTGACVLRYHPLCWKEFEKDIQKKPKELINERCPTPDCGCRLKNYFFFDPETRSRKGEVCQQAETKEEKKAKRKTRRDDFIGAGFMLGQGLERARADSEVYSEESGDVNYNNCRDMDDEDSDKETEEAAAPQTSAPSTKDPEDVPPPDLPAVPLKKDNLEEEYATTTKKKGGKKKMKDKKKQVLDLGLTFGNKPLLGASSSSYFVGEDTVRVPQPPPLAPQPRQPLALADNQGPQPSFPPPHPPTDYIPRDVSAFSEEEKLDMIARLEDTEKVREFLTMIVQILVEKGTWVTMDTGGLVDDLFRGNEVHGPVQKLIELYGGRKEFLGAYREDDSNAIMVDTANNRIILKDHLLYDRPERSSDSVERALNSGDSAGRSRSAESHSSSGISSSSNENHPVTQGQEGGGEEGKVEEEEEETWNQSDEEGGEREELSLLKKENANLKKELENTRTLLEREKEANRAHGSNIAELNDQLCRSNRANKSDKQILNNRISELQQEVQELEMEKGGLQPEMSRLKQEVKNLKERVKQLQDHMARERNRWEEDLEKQKKQMKNKEKQLVERATEAEVKILESKLATFKVHLQSSKQRCAEELARFKAVSQQLKAAENGSLKAEWGTYVTHWMQYRKSLDTKGNAFTAEIEAQKERVKSGVALGTLNIAVPPDLDYPAIPRPREPWRETGRGSTGTSFDSYSSADGVPQNGVRVEEARNLPEEETSTVELIEHLPRPIPVESVEVMRPVPVPVPRSVIPAPGLRPPFGERRGEQPRDGSLGRRSGNPGGEGRSDVDQPSSAFHQVAASIRNPTHSPEKTQQAEHGDHRGASGQSQQQPKQDRAISTIFKAVKELFPGHNVKAEFKTAVDNIRRQRGIQCLNQHDIVQLVTAQIRDIRYEQAQQQAAQLQARMAAAAPMAIVPPPGVPRARENPGSARAGNNSECYVCLEFLREGEATERCPSPTCNVRLHHKCLEEWLKTKSTCPICHTHMILNSDYPPL